MLPCTAKAWRLANRDRYLSLSTAAAVKTCRRCRVEKPLASFYHQMGRRDGRFSVCRECLTANTLAWQLADPEPHRRAVERWRVANRRLVRIARRVQSTVRRAIRSGELVRPDVCEYCGKACKPDAAHADWERPLDIAWLCRRCRAGWDRDHPKGRERHGARA